LRGRRFASALEIGCSIGVLTARLAPHCDRILAVDCAQTALASAGQRLGTSGSVQFARMVLPGEWPAGWFDLVMLSEILYFWDERDIALAARRVARCLLPGGLALVVNWRGPNDGPLPGDAAASRFMAALPQSWQRAAPTLQQAYRIDLAERPMQRPM
jgi:SAM-dependent methyltransferase